MFQRLIRVLPIVSFLLAMVFTVASVSAGTCRLLVTQPTSGSVHVDADLKDCGIDIDQTNVTLTITHSDGSVVPQKPVKGTHAGWDFREGNGKVCAAGTAYGVTVNADPPCVVFGNGGVAQSVQPTAGSVIQPTAASQQAVATAIPATIDPGQGGGSANVDGTMTFSETAGDPKCPEKNWVLVVTDKLNVRKQPDLNAEVLAKAPKGNCFTWLGNVTNASGNWFYIQSSQGTGYAKNSSKYTMSDTASFTAAVPTVAPTAAAILPQSTATPVIVDYLKKVKVVADAQVYTEIVTFTKFGWVTKDSIYEYVMTSADGLWMQIKGSNGKTAWVSKSYVKPEQGSVEVRLTPTPLPTATGGAPATPVPTATVVNDPLKTVELLQNAPAYAAPSVDSIVVANGSASTKLNYHYSSQDGNWFFVSYQNTVSGWFPKSLLKKVSGTSEVLDPNIGVTVPTCGNTTTRLSLYGWGVSTQEGAPLNVREDSEQFTAKAKKLGQIPNGGKFQVIGLPKCVEGRNYWLVVHQIDAGHVLVGRIAESVDGKYTVDPLVVAAATPVQPTPTLEAGVG